MKQILSVTINQPYNFSQLSQRQENAVHQKNVKKLPPLSVFISITVTESTAQKKKMMITIFFK